MKNCTQNDLLQSLAQKISCTSKSIAAIPNLLINGLELNCAQINILFCIAKECDDGKMGRSIKDLASKLNITSGAVSQFVDGLFKAGIIVRIENNKDRRALRVMIDKKAQEKFEFFKKEYFACLNKIFEGLNEHEISQLANLMKKIKFDE
jgi:DNA-binding MarR family transcriptional regulator